MEKDSLCEKLSGFDWSATNCGWRKYHINSRILQMDANPDADLKTAFGSFEYGEGKKDVYIALKNFGNNKGGFYAHGADCGDACQIGDPRGGQISTFEIYGPYDDLRDFSQMLGKNPWGLSDYTEAIFGSFSCGIEKKSLDGKFMFYRASKIHLYTPEKGFQAVVHPGAIRYKKGVLASFLQDIDFCYQKIGEYRSNTSFFGKFFTPKGWKYLNGWLDIREFMNNYPSLRTKVLKKVEECDQELKSPGKVSISKIGVLKPWDGIQYIKENDIQYIKEIKALAEQITTKNNHQKAKNE